jgi:hypothetical protein
MPKLFAINKLPCYLPHFWRILVLKKLMNKLLNIPKRNYKYL